MLASEHDRAFARQAAEMRAVHPHATFHTLVGAVFTQSDAYIAQIRGFLEQP